MNLVRERNRGIFVFLLCLKLFKMTSFTYTYHEKECTGNFHPSDKGRGWIKVMFFEHSTIILPAGFQTKNNKMIWVQFVQQGEAIWPHELIQTLGEAIENSSQM
jgi:hypothetical protein